MSDDGALILRVLHGARNVPEFSAAIDLLVAIRVAWLPKPFDPYRPQATLFDGQPNGKIEIVLR